jgi:hypothetical protein
LDIGDFPEYLPVGDDSPNDPERPVRLVARVVARGADRIAPLKKLSRHLEGTDAKSGLLTDLTAAAFDLYSRNSDEVETLITEYVKNVQSKSANRRKAKGGSAAQTTQEQGV